MTIFLQPGLRGFWICSEAKTLFRELNPDLWRATGENPVMVLQRLSSERMNEIMNDVPEAEFATGEQSSDDSEEQSDLLAQLQAKVNAHHEESEPMFNPDEVWEGDPGDGTDFIPVVDLPIEDHAVLPNYDMFDNPTTPMPSAQQTLRPAVVQQQVSAAYDFSALRRVHL